MVKTDVMNRRIRQFLKNPISSSNIFLNILNSKSLKKRNQVYLKMNRLTHIKFEVYLKYLPLQLTGRSIINLDISDRTQINSVEK
jgi:hypothetical protein